MCGMDTAQRFAASAIESSRGASRVSVVSVIALPIVSAKTASSAAPPIQRDLRVTA
jgi:hypothetical protein